MSMPMQRGYPVVDADCHILEPDTIISQYLEPKFRAEAWEKYPAAWANRPDLWKTMNMNTQRGGSYCIGMEAPEALKYAVSHEGYIFPGAYDGAERIKSMDAEGIDIGVVRNTMMAGVGRLPESDYLLVDALCRAYNNWLYDFCSADPKRLLPEALLPCACMPMALAEAERTAKLGFRGAVVRGSTPGPRPLSDPYWDKLFACFQDLGWPVCVHASFDPSVPSSAKWLAPFVADPAEAHTFWAIHANLNFLLDNIVTLGEITLGGMLDKFPKLNVTFIEGGHTWVGEVLYRLDKSFDCPWVGFRGLTEPYGAKTRPSELFKRQVYVQFEGGDQIPSHEQIYALKDNLIWCSDIPHWDADSPQEGWQYLDKVGVSKELERQIMCGNAAKIYGIEVPDLVTA